MDATKAPLGHTSAALAFFSWGVMPFYFQLVTTASLWELMAHRIVWSLLSLSLFFSIKRSWPSMLARLRESESWRFAGAGAVLIFSNWLLFTWAVTNGHILEASFGYFINPVFNMLLARLFFSERLKPAQRTAAACALAGILVQLIALGSLPLISLGLAATFGFYGLLKKKSPLPAVPGFWMETFFLAPVALILLTVMQSRGQMTFGHEETGAALNLLLVVAGPLTAFPLILYGIAAKRLPFTVLSFYQYLAPTLQFGAALLTGEAVSPAKFLSFACVWFGLATLMLTEARMAWQTNATDPPKHA